MDLSVKKYVPVGSAPVNVWRMVGIPSRGAQLHKWIHEDLRLLFYKRLAAVLDVPERRLRQYLCITPSAFSRRVSGWRWLADVYANGVLKKEFSAGQAG
ncbi:hypothetical protein ACYZT3_10475 [Pseudomonas sp. MDT1-16]